MTRRAIIEVLADLDRPVQPSSDFADALFARLEAEMAETAPPDAPPAHGTPSSVDLPGPAAQAAARRWFTRPLAVAAGVLIVAITAVALGTLPGGTPSALATYEQAQEQFAGAPSVIATVEQRQFGEVIAEERREPLDSLPDLVTVKDYQWADADHFRVDVVSNSYADRPDDLGMIDLPEGSFEVADGEYHARFNAAENTLYVEDPERFAAEDRQLRGLGLLDPSLHYFSTFTDVQFDQRCDVLEDETIAGRLARHIHCTEADVQGTHDIQYDLWLDFEFGTVLRYDIDGTPSSSGWIDVGGSVLEVRDISYGAKLDPDVFTIEVPDGAKVEWLGRPPAPPQFRGPKPPKQLTVPISGWGDALAVDGDVVWVAGIAGGTGASFKGGTGTMYRVDAATGHVLSDTPLRPMRNRLPRDETGPLVTAQAIGMAGDRIWVAEHHAGSSTRKGNTYSYRYRVEQLNRATGQLVGSPVELPGNVAGMVVAGDALWVAAAYTRTEIDGPAHLDLGEVQQLDIDNGRVRTRSKVEGSPLAIAASPNGRQVWMLADEPNRVDVYAPPTQVLYRIETATGEVVNRTALPVDPWDAQFEDALAVGAEAVYVTADDGGRGRVYKIDPATGDIVARGKAGVAPSAAAFGQGALWVIDRKSEQLLRIHPDTLNVESSTQTAPDPVTVSVSESGVWLTHYDGSARFFQTPR